MWPSGLQPPSFCGSLSHLTEGAGQSPIRGPTGPKRSRSVPLRDSDRAGRSSFSVAAAVPGPNDEMVLEAAINGRADAPVTYNVADFAGPAERSRISVLRPGELLKKVKP